MTLIKIKALKVWLKKFRLIYDVNALLKSYELKRGVRNVTRYYEKKGTPEEKHYNETTAIAEFKAQHRELRPNYVAKKIGDLNFFWVGASQTQDESGLLQALNRLGNVTTFRNSYEEYGPHYEIPQLNWLKVREINDSSLMEQVEQAHSIQKIDCLNNIFYF